MKPLKFRSFLLAMMLCALCVTQASALEYTFDAPEDYLFDQPTSDDTIYEWENPNVDRSKNTALIAPGFGTPTSYLPGSGEYLTPNLVPGALSGGLVNQVGSANLNGGTAGSSVVPGEYPSVSGGSNVTMTQIPGGSPTDIAQGSTTRGYTEVTDDLYYSNGSLKDRAPPQTNSHRRSRQIHRRQKSRQSSLHPMTRFHGNAPGSKHGKLFLPGRAAQALGRPLGSG